MTMGRLAGAGVTLGALTALMVFSVNGFGVAIVSSLGSDDTREITKSNWLI
jgi:hypothetical protein